MFKKIRNFITSLFYKEKRIPRGDDKKRSNFVGVQSSQLGKVEEVVRGDGTQVGVLYEESKDKNTLRVEQHPGFTRVTNRMVGESEHRGPRYIDPEFILGTPIDMDPLVHNFPVHSPYHELLSSMGSDGKITIQNKDIVLPLTIGTEHSTPRDHMCGGKPSASEALIQTPRLSDDEYQARREALVDKPGMVRKHIAGSRQAFIGRPVISPAQVPEENHTEPQWKYGAVEHHAHTEETDFILSQNVDKVSEADHAEIELHVTKLDNEVECRIGKIKEVKVRLKEPSKNEKRKMSPRRIKKESKKVIKPAIGKHR